MIFIALLLALLMASIQVGSSLTFSGNSNGLWSNAVSYGGGTPTCIRYSNPATNVAYGYPTTGPNRGTCPTNIDISHQSGFGFVPNTAITNVPADTEFLLGTFTHYNFPITIQNNNLNNRLRTVIMSLTLTLTDSGGGTSTTLYPFTVTLDETPNSYPCAYTSTTPCADRVSFPSSDTSSTFVGSDGLYYTLVITGFKMCGSSGTAISEYITQENSENSACIYGKMKTCTMTVTGPSSQAICSPNLNPPASFSVIATGTGTLTYQWYKQLGSTQNPLTDTMLTNTAPYSGVTTSTLVVSPTSPSVGVYGTYYVVVTSASCKMRSNSATLTVYSIPELTVQEIII